MLKPRLEIDPLDHPGDFRLALREWFRREGRDYPWRRTREPWAILVSEVMLQQTQVATVLKRGFYSRFLEAFPSPAELAGCDDDTLLKAWEGLGYYRRARQLREAARVIERDHGGRIPASLEGILALPGVGRYTAGAVWSFAFDQPAPIVDGNITRVLARLMDFADEVNRPAAQRQLWDWADALLDRRQPRLHNSALMELGQTRCRPGVPDCLSCPVARFCRSAEPESLPRKAAGPATTAVDEHVVFARRAGRVLLHKLAEGRRSGMWRLPVREPVEVAALELLHRRKYGITRYRVTLHVHRAGRLKAGADERWHAIDELGKLAMPPADRAALMAVLGEE